MKKYIEPAYKKESVETKDFVLASLTITDLGEGTLGNITGQKGALSADFSDIFAMR